MSAVDYLCQDNGNTSGSGDVTTVEKQFAQITLSTSANQVKNRSDANGVFDDAHVNVSLF